MVGISTLPRSFDCLKSYASHKLCSAFLLAWVLPALALAQAITYSAPLVITKGGTYTGNYQSLASGVPCVRINTTAPVILSGCFLAGAGNLIEAGSGANLTVRNCTGQGLTPSVNNQAPGRFIDVYQAQNLVIEHNIFTSTSGIVINRWSGSGGSGQTLTVRYNQARNIDGRWRNGGSTLSSCLLLNTVQQVAGIEIAYNEIINTPDQSLVEDNINLYNSSGTAQSALRVHDNFVRGAYPYPATATSFSGTGMTTDGDGSTLATAAGYIEADHNQFVGTGNAAMNLAAGHDVYYHDNRAVTSGYLPDGRQFKAGWAGLGVFNYYNQPASVFFNNRIENNTVGYVRWGVNSPYANRQDLSPGACAPCTGTVSLPNPITTATEDAEWTLWQQKLLAAGITVGPVGAAPTTSAPTANTTGTVLNPGFELDGAAVGAPTGWLTQTGTGTYDNADYTEIYPGAHSGTYHATHYRPTSYEVYTYQTISGLANGTYSFRAWVKTDGGQPQAHLRASKYGGTTLTTTIAATSGSWVQLAVGNIAVSNGQCEIGFYSNANAGQWLYFDDVELTRQNTPPTVSLTAAPTLVLGQALVLSATAADADGSIAKVEFFAGTTKLGEATAAPYQLSWTPTITGSYSLSARATDNGATSTTSAAASLLVTAPVATGPTAFNTNLVVNPSFELDGASVGAPTGWQTQTGTGTNDNADYTEAYGGAHLGAYHATHYRPTSYEVYTYQTISGLTNGTYRLRAWVKSGGSQAQVRARNYGGPALSLPLTSTNQQWVQVEISSIAVSNGQCEIGFYSNARSDQWFFFDDVELTRQATTPPATATVANPGFELDGAPVGAPTGWLTLSGTSTTSDADYTETYAGAHSGTYHGTHYQNTSYEVYTYQTLAGLAAGTYKLSAWVRTGGGQAQALLRARNYGGPALATTITATAGGNWALVEINNINVSNGQCEIGFYSQASAGQWLFFDDITLVAQAATANTLLNASYDDDQAAVWAPRQWVTQTYGTTPYFASYSETYGGAHTGTYHGTHYRPENYEVYTYQTVTNLANGTYTLSAWVRSTGGQAQVQLQAKNYGGALVVANIPASPNQWVQVSLPGIVVSYGTCEVGFYSRASGGQWLHFDDIELVRQNTAARTSLATKTSATAVSAPVLYPNPANDQVVVTATFAQATVADLVIVDTQGIPVATYHRQASGGDNQFPIQTSHLPSGLYTLQIKGSQTIVTQRLEIRH
jgi:hypothetical protein